MHLRSKDSESPWEWKIDRTAALPLDRRSLARAVARIALSLLLVVGGVLSNASPRLFAQAPANSAPPAQTAPAKPSLPAAAGSAPLTVDRAPVASPDPQPAQAGQQPAKQPAAGQQTAQKGPGGKFTLREDAYEVRLNATVLEGNRSVLDLPED